MKYCNTCQVQVSTPSTLCPLCAAPLVKGEQDETLAYPLTQPKKGYNFIKRLLLFLSGMALLGSIAINLVFTPGFWWWPLAATVMVYAWAVVLHAMRRGGNGAGKILMQVVCLSALVVLIDVETGYRGWSTTVMLPAIFCGGIISVVVLILVNRTSWAGYVMYQVILALFGFVPLVLFFTGYATNFLAALGPALLAAASLLMLFLFSDKSIKNEFRRRLRF